MLRAVFDTNVVIGAQTAHGTAHRCWLLAETNLVRLIHCRQMLAELSEKLLDKFDFDVNDVRGVMFDYRRISDEVTITGNLHVVSDPDDNMFVECAAVAGVDGIVSNDRHLLSLGEYQGIPILKPVEFLRFVDERFNPPASASP